jgi:hypothetical protein
MSDKPTEPNWNDPKTVQLYHDHAMKVWAAMVPANATLASAQMTGLLSFATTAINAAILLNGAAATALMALLGTVWGSSGDKVFAVVFPVAVESLIYFAMGAFMATASAGVSYLSQAAFNDAVTRSIAIENEKLHVPPKPPNASAEIKRKIAVSLGQSLRVVGVGLFCMSLGAFYLGAEHGLDSLQAAIPVFPK